MSRVHLRCGAFKRDYGVESSSKDLQSAHGSWTAGTTCARGLEEAAGHVEVGRAEYRAVSREWHEFLGFRLSDGTKKRANEELEPNANRGG